jgi:hypothetical protein
MISQGGLVGVGGVDKRREFVPQRFYWSQFDQRETHRLLDFALFKRYVAEDKRRKKRQVRIPLSPPVFPDEK